MLKNKIFINGIGTIAPAEKWNEIDHPKFLRCIEPDYKKYISPNNIRRMGRLIKMSLYAAHLALEESKQTKPNAIITGTGLGCIDDTEKFLKNMIHEEGTMLSPTTFIHSTHNTISSQIAIALNCTAYNSTYVHRSLSFESALTDAILQFQEANNKEEKNILVGGVDEMTAPLYEITNQLGFWKKSEENINRLADSNTEGSIAGEGANFFSLSNLPTATTYAELIAVKSIRGSQNLKEIKSSINTFLTSANLNFSEIDLLVLGINGDVRYDYQYKNISNLFSENCTQCYFKNISGEYFTGSAFGLALVARAIQNGNLPEPCILKGSKKSKYRNVLLYNQSQGIHHSFYLLSHVEV
jgi:3-oxoacyl-(acyl-carrier-protein) synthase